jgi:calcineurin-like phosphoesterase family protein
MCLVAVVADVQVGHEAALWPKGFVLNKGNQYKLANHQKILLQYWKDYWTSPEVRDAEYVIDLGECIEGNNRKENGRALLTPNIDIQCDAYVELIRKYVAGKKIFGVTASGYHDSTDTDTAKRIQEELNGTYCGVIANLKIKKTGHVIWATHKGGDAMLYRSTMLDRNSLYFSAIKGRLEEDPDLILYGHHHKHFRVDTETRINLIAPTWKLWHPIKGAAKFPYTQPTLGGIVLKLPNKRKQIEVVKKFYPLEHLYSALREI